MKKNRLEILKRKNIGKGKQDAYKRLFSIFESSQWFDLEEADEILEKMKLKTVSSVYENELIKESHSFIDSDLMREVYQKINKSALSYVFTDDYKYCGIYLVNSKEALSNSLEIARKDDGNTSFILDNKFAYFFRINYYDKGHNDFPNCFDIQRCFM